MANNFFWIGGFHPVDEAIKNKRRNVLKILTTNKDINIYHRDNKILEICEKNKINKIFQDYDFNNQGYAALIEDLTLKNQKNLFSNLDNESAVMLDNITDVHNIGSIFRTCLAFDIRKIILLEQIYKFNSPIIYKTSSGTIEHLDIFAVKNLSRTLEDLKKNDYWVYAFDNSNQSKDIMEVKFSKKNIFVYGSEGKGISRLIKKKSDFYVKININKKVNSLNVSNSVSASLMAYKYFKKD